MNVTLFQAHDNATCNNSDGSHMCMCKAGFSGDGVQCQGMEFVKCL